MGPVSEVLQLPNGRQHEKDYFISQVTFSWVDHLRIAILVYSVKVVASKLGDAW